jgi:hypothetical protein
MENTNENALNDFLSEEEKKNASEDAKKVVLKEREGLIERVDKVLITKDGKQLLREQY